jgi:hypothetical protein
VDWATTEKMIRQARDELRARRTSGNP